MAPWGQSLSLLNFRYTRYDCPIVLIAMEMGGLYLPTIVQHVVVKVVIDCPRLRKF